MDRRTKEPRVGQHHLWRREFGSKKAVVNKRKKRKKLEKEERKWRKRKGVDNPEELTIRIRN